jgi:hypothetical protein
MSVQDVDVTKSEKKYISSLQLTIVDVFSTRNQLVGLKLCLSKQWQNEMHDWKGAPVGGVGRFRTPETLSLK